MIGGAVSICTHCGQDHDARGGVCAAAATGAPNRLQISAKTMFGVAPAPLPLQAKPATKVPAAATLLAPAQVRLPAPARPTLPTADEARQNPNLVISLDVTPPPAQGPGNSAPLAGAGTSPLVASPPRRLTPILEMPVIRATTPVALPVARPAPPPSQGIELDRSPSPDVPTDLPTGEPPVDLTGNVGAESGDSPVDLPKPGSGPRMALPEPPAPEPRGNQSAAHRGFADRLTADVRSVIELFGWASTLYLRSPKQLFLLAAFLVLPASMLESCVGAGLAASTASPAAATVDFSARKAELARRIQESQSRGALDGQAVAELAALTTAETVQLPATPAGEGTGWLRTHLAMFVQGLLILGLAFPLACGVLAIAIFDREGGAALPAFADVWPVLLARSELFLVSLVPAALLVAVGHALFVVPGLVLGVLFVFVPHVVLFEKRGGRAALLRSVALAREQAGRTVLTCAAFALAGAVIALASELLLPTSASRASAFLHFIVCDLLTVAVLPIPALVLARIYLDLRGGRDQAERLSRAARA